MSCSRGHANPDRQTTLRLFADSAGYCQRPDCPNRLFVDTGSKNVHIAEMAHIIAASGEGPRGDRCVVAADKGAYENLILLCANCHTIIDKAPADFPVVLIERWKRKHVERIRALFDVEELPDRASVREAIEPPLTENRSVFELYGPDNDYRQDPESELANVWQRKVLSTILPNNRRILAILDANRRHLNGTEARTVEEFRQHIDDLEAKHIGGGASVAGLFPAGMSTILKDAE